MPSIFGYGLCSLCSGFSSVVVGSFRFGVSVFFFVGLGGIVCPVLAYAGRMPVSDQWLARASLSYSLTSPGAYGRSSIHGWTRGTVPCSSPSLSVIGSLWVEYCYWVFSFLLFLFSFYFLGVSYVCPMYLRERITLRNYFENQNIPFCLENVASEDAPYKILIQYLDKTQILKAL